MEGWRPCCLLAAGIKLNCRHGSKDALPLMCMPQGLATNVHPKPRARVAPPLPPCVATHILKPTLQTCTV